MQQHRHGDAKKMRCSHTGTCDIHVPSALMSNPGPGPQLSTDVQAPACPAQITEEAILAFPNDIALPAIDEANAPHAVTESYAKLVQHYSESVSLVQSGMRSLNRAWDFACVLAQKFPLVQPASQALSLPDSVSEPSPSAVAPAGTRSAVQSSGALARDPVLFHKLAEASISSLKRRDKLFMGEVFNRHAKPLGLSAQALVSALHAIDPSSFMAHVSDAASAKKLKEVETRNKGHADFEEFCQAAKMICAEGAGTSAASDVFLRFADVKGLSAEALLDALKEVDAPVLLSTEGCSPEQIFRRADANASGSVDLAESDPPLVLVIFRCVMLVTLVSGSCVQLSCPTTWK